MEFKDRIRALRTERELTATKLAAEFGKSDTAVRMWETGKSKPDVDTLIKLAEYFDVSTDYLVGLSDSRNPDAIVSMNENLNLLGRYVAKDEENCKGLIEGLNFIFSAAEKHFAALSAVPNFLLGGFVSALYKISELFDKKSEITETDVAKMINTVFSYKNMAIMKSVEYSADYLVYTVEQFIMDNMNGPEKDTLMQSIENLYDKKSMTHIPVEVLAEKMEDWDKSADGKAAIDETSKLIASSPIYPETMPKV